MHVQHRYANPRNPRPCRSQTRESSVAPTRLQERNQEMNRVHRRRPTGFTLLELLVVLVILVGLAGVIVPLIPSVRAQTHAATGASNITTTANQIRVFESIVGGLPNQLDSLVDENGDLLTTLRYDNSGGELSVDVLDGSDDLNFTDAEIVDALEEAGLTQAAEMANAATLDDASATFDPYTEPATFIVSLDPISDPVEGLIFDASNDYLVFGIGGLNSAIGKTMQEAPIHFPEEGSVNDVYDRFLLVVEISGGEEVRATPYAVVVAHDDALDAAGHSVEEFFEITGN